MIYLFAFIMPVMMALVVIALFRNEKVYALRLHMINTMQEKSREDIRAGRDWEWRGDEYDKVEYFEMVFKFWKPIKAEAFWNDTSFLK